MDILLAPFYPKNLLAHYYFAGFKKDIKLMQHFQQYNENSFNLAEIHSLYCLTCSDYIFQPREELCYKLLCYCDIVFL
jgi:hypothetical protein